MPNRSRGHEITIEQLSEHAEGHTALAKYVALDETREALERMARLLTRLGGRAEGLGKTRDVALGRNRWLLG
jgi:hypothetical protein